jgi:hypothetical protein
MRKTSDIKHLLSVISTPQNTIGRLFLTQYFATASVIGHLLILQIPQQLLIFNPRPRDQPPRQDSPPNFLDPTLLYPQLASDSRQALCG